jgi:hypothetical protein
MIKYIKDSDRVIKLDDETQSLSVCLVKGTQLLMRNESNNPVLYNEVANVKYADGVFVDATEQEYLDKKAEILAAL